MWVSQSALERIRELELALRESVSREVYEASLARIAELERRNDWAMDMLLRRGQSYPVPPLQPEGPQPEPEPPAPSDTALAQAEAIVAEGKRLKMGREEIEQAITLQTGLTGQDLAAVMSGRVM